VQRVPQLDLGGVAQIYTNHAPVFHLPLYSVGSLFPSQSLTVGRIGSSCAEGLDVPRVFRIVIKHLGF